MAPTTTQPTSLIFMGTGTSGAVPAVSCLTSPQRHTTPCPTCCSSNPKNTRLNTGAIFQLLTPSGSSKTLLIDCGKTFFSSAIRIFPQHSLRRIDALLLTHAHADAFFGLDDLRSWTLASPATNEPAIQSHIDVYCDRTTMAEVERTFPYLVDKGRATGGGDVPSFVWHVFESEGLDGDRGFEVAGCEGLRVLPLPVEHGRFMSTGDPFMCMGYRVGGFSWVSDCSGVPERTRERMRGSRVMVMDGLKWDPHASHFSIQQGREWVRDELGSGSQWRKQAKAVTNGTSNEANGHPSDEGPERTWLVGFSHNVEHEHATTECASWGSSTEGQGMWVRPAWDGLKIGIDGLPIEDQDQDQDQKR